MILRQAIHRPFKTSRLTLVRKGGPARFVDRCVRRRNCALLPGQLFSGSNRTVASKPYLPVTLRAPLLVGLAMVSLILLAVLEVLTNECTRWKFHVCRLWPSTEFWSNLYLSFYLPTIIVVLGSMTRDWIDFDVKRLEGFFPLSEDEGALGSESVLLSYPVELLPLVPPRAAKRRSVCFDVGFGRANDVDNGPLSPQDWRCS